MCISGAVTYEHVTLFYIYFDVTSIRGKLWSWPQTTRPDGLRLSGHVFLPTRPDGLRLSGHVFLPTRPDGLRLSGHVFLPTRRNIDYVDVTDRVCSRFW